MTDSTCFKINLPDGSELRLSIISPADWITYADRFRTSRKVRLTQTLRFSDVSGDALVKELKDFDAKKLRQYDVQQWVTELDGAAEMLALSISRGWELWKDGQKVEEHPKAKRTTEDIPPQLSHLDYVDAAAGVANLKLSYETQEDTPPNAASRQIETGGETQTESDTGSTLVLTTP